EDLGRREVLSTSHVGHCLGLRVSRERNPQRRCQDRVLIHGLPPMLHASATTQLSAAVSRRRWHCLNVPGNPKHWSLWNGSSFQGFERELHRALIPFLRPCHHPAPPITE